MNPESTHTDGGSETVLVVDDQPLVRDLTARLLQRSGYRVIKANGGDEALAMAARYEGPLHLLLTDFLMPGMSGHELARRLREVRPETRVLYSTGYDASTIGRLGADDSEARFVQKPYTGASLLEAVREVLDSPARRPAEPGD